MKFTVIKQHRSEYPEPITFTKGTRLTVGEKYDGVEGWENWYFCTTLGQQGGWVPAQVIEQTGSGFGIALEDYTARDLDVDSGENVIGGRVLNGWVWCTKGDSASSKTGWVPRSNLRVVDQGADRLSSGFNQKPL